MIRHDADAIAGLEARAAGDALYAIMQRVPMDPAVKNIVTIAIIAVVAILVVIILLQMGHVGPIRIP